MSRVLVCPMAIFSHRPVHCKSVASAATGFTCTLPPCPAFNSTGLSTDATRRKSHRAPTITSRHYATLTRIALSALLIRSHYNLQTTDVMHAGRHVPVNRGGGGT